MADYQRYAPTPIYLPSDGKLSRTFYNTRSHLDGRPQLEESDYEGFESHIIFNDIFIHADGSCIQGIGPPLVNLSAHLLPMELCLMNPISNEEVQLKPKIRNFDRVSFFKFTLPQTLHDATSLSITLRFANKFEQSLTVGKHNLPAVELQMVTLQKNNPVEWILDWLFYVAHLGVDRVVLYDNGSDNVEELERALSEVSTELSIVLVDWPYPYGPIRSYYNQFCQATQNNHVYQCFGAADWVGHFDIDEYLIRASDASVVEGSLKELVRNTRSHIGLLRFDSYWIPRLEEGSSHQLPTVRQFTSRMRRLRGRAHKYLMRASAYRMANTHNGKVQFGFFRKAVKAHHWVFLHYKPLTTNWRSYVVRGTAEEYDSELHIEDKRIANFFNDTD